MHKSPCQITRCQPHSPSGENLVGCDRSSDNSKIYPRREDDARDFDSLGADLPISVGLGYGGELSWEGIEHGRKGLERNSDSSDRSG